jgi:hypothetical protein
MGKYFGLTNLMTSENIILNNNGFNIPSAEEMLFLIHYFDWKITHDIICGCHDESYVWIWKSQVWKKNIKYAWEEENISERERLVDGIYMMKYYNFPIEEYIKFTNYNKCNFPKNINRQCKNCQYNNKINNLSDYETTNLTYFWN